MMTKRIITYQLSDEDDYDDLHAAIEAFDDWIHPMRSVWFVDTNKSSKKVRSELEEYIDSDYQIYVGKATDWSFYMQNHEWFQD